MTKIDELLKSETVGVLARVIGFVASGLGAWALLVLLNVQSDVAILKAGFTSFSKDQYRADEARRDFELRDLKISTQGSVITALQSRVDALEREVHSTNTRVEEIAPPIRRRPQ